MVSLHERRAPWLEQLEGAGAFAPAFELCELICFATGWDAAAQRTRAGEAFLQADVVEKISALVARRCAGEPLQYILGEWEFYGLPFYVGEGVLIPRADTETLVDQARRLEASRADRAGRGVTGSLESTRQLRIADLCSGTGCVAIALAKHLPEAEVFAVELSEVAYGYLTRNIVRNSAANVTPLLGDALADWPQLHNLDIIVSNPPYIRTEELAGLAPEVRREPELALDGKGDGLWFYRELVRVCRARMKPGGWLLFECGDHQAPEVLELLRTAGYTELGTRRDLEGFERVVFGRAEWPLSFDSPETK